MPNDTSLTPCLCRRPAVIMVDGGLTPVCDIHLSEACREHLKGYGPAGIAFVVADCAARLKDDPGYAVTFSTVGVPDVQWPALKAALLMEEMDLELDAEDQTAKVILAALCRECCAVPAVEEGNGMCAGCSGCDIDEDEIRDRIEARRADGAERDLRDMRAAGRVR